jgi:hypothetical protein
LLSESAFVFMELEGVDDSLFTEDLDLDYLGDFSWDDYPSSSLHSSKEPADNLNSSPSSPSVSTRDDDEQRYLNCVEKSIKKLETLQLRPFPFVLEDLFSSSKCTDSPQGKKRWEVGKKKFIHFDIFPWFRYLEFKNIKIRPTNDDATIARVLKAMNYFWSRPPYAPEELAHLRQLFFQFGAGKGVMKESLSRIVTVYGVFTVWCEGRGGPASPVSHGARVGLGSGSHGKSLGDVGIYPVDPGPPPYSSLSAHSRRQCKPNSPITRRGFEIWNSKLHHPRPLLAPHQDQRDLGMASIEPPGTRSAPQRSPVAMCGASPGVSSDCTPMGWARSSLSRVALSLLPKCGLGSQRWCTQLDRTPSRSTLTRSTPTSMFPS